MDDASVLLDRSKLKIKYALVCDLLSKRKQGEGVITGSTDKQNDQYNVRSFTLLIITVYQAEIVEKILLFFVFKCISIP